MSCRTNKLKSAYLKSLEERYDFIYASANNIVFNFKFFVSGEHYGQSFKDWQTDGILSEFNEKLKEFSGKTITDLLLDETLEIYADYPNDSKFKIPDALKSANVKLVRLRLTERRRVIGFMLKDSNPEIKASEKCKNIFYVVFLDKKHEFAPYRKK